MRNLGLTAEDSIHRHTAYHADLTGVTQLRESLESSFHEVVGVGRTLRLGEDVLHTGTLEHGAHGTTGLESGTFGCGFDENLRTAELGNLLVGNGALENGNLDEILLGGLYTLGNGSLNFACLTKSVTDRTVAVTDNHDSCEREGTTTFGNFRYTVESDQTVLQLNIVGILYFNHIQKPLLGLKFEATLACCVSQSLHAAVIKVTVTVENSLSDACGNTLLGDSLTNLCCNLGLGAAGETLGRSRYDGLALMVVDSLYIYALVRTEYAQTGTLGRTEDALADAVLDLYSSFFLRNHNL